MQRKLTSRAEGISYLENRAIEERGARTAKVGSARGAVIVGWKGDRFTERQGLARRRPCGCRTSEAKQRLFSRTLASSH